MTSLDDYEDRYSEIAFERTDSGVLTMTVHTNGESLRWGPEIHDQLYRAFRDVGDDRDNKVVIFTGVGDEFSGPICSPGEQPVPRRLTPAEWDVLYHVGKNLQLNLLNIPVPMIAAINGPAWRHMELPLLCDITIASDTAVFADSGHFEHGNLVPGDGINVLCTLLMGHNRARYFHLMGQQLTATEAQAVGLVNEVVPKAEVMPRATAIAAHLATKPLLQLRYSRAILTETLKQEMQRLVGYGFALEGLAMSDPSSAFANG
jgi:enoyl-CoA hydratase/carnithine racemase